MNFDQNRLYDLLPALYRLRDAATGRALTGSDDDGPLRALLGLIAEQAGVLEENLAQLYDDQFIETCAEWVVPYLGDLVGARGLSVFPGADFSQRSQVANTLRYRRRKGTAAVLEQLARDVTGQDAAVVEYFLRLATTQYLNHLRPDNLAVASLRDTDALERLNSPFDTITRTADVRRIEPKRGTYNIPNIGVFLWRIDSYPLTQAPAFCVDARRYTFDALGRDLPLYNLPIAETEITHLAEPDNVPMPLSRQRLACDLALHYGASASLLIHHDGVPVLPTNLHPLADLICVCDLSNIKNLVGQDVLDGAGQPVGWVNMPTVKIAVDPVLGRLAFPPTSPPPTDVRVDYHYGFSMGMGGGQYGRADTFIAPTPAPIVKQVASNTPNGIQTALDELAVTGGVVELTDNGYYAETFIVRVTDRTTIELRGADEKRPVLLLSGDLTVIGTQADATADASAEFILNGLLVCGGRVRVPVQDGAGNPNPVAAIRVRHSTLLPGASPAFVTSAGVGLLPAQSAMPRLVVEALACAVEITDSITGSLRVNEKSTISLKNSIIDAGNSTEIAITGLLPQNVATVFAADQPGPPLTVVACTVIGKVHAVMITLASNTIFLADLAPADGWPAPLLADRTQQGCVRFSYLPPGSRVPTPHRCQPRTAADAARVRPVFTTLRYGYTGYCQLSLRGAAEIGQGADDGAEMGAFHDRYQPQREANLRTRLDEYLRFGLDAGIFFES